MQQLSVERYKLVGAVLRRESVLTNECCMALGVPTYRLKPQERLSDGAVLAYIRTAQPDIVVLAGFDRILPRAVLDIPRITLNLHAGRLPEYRGASVMQWQIINGETQAACTIHVVDEGIDTGPIVTEELVDIGPNMTGGELFQELMEIFPSLLLRVIRDLEKGEATASSQDEARARSYRKRRSDDGEIQWHTMRAIDVHNLVRALSGRSLQAAFTYLDRARVGIHRTELWSSEIAGTPGTIVAEHGGSAVVMCTDATILVTRADTRLEVGRILASHREP